MSVVRYGVVAWIHGGEADDFPISTCLGEYPRTTAGRADAEELVREILKLQGSKDLTDFELVEMPLDMTVCGTCLVRDMCGR